MSSSASYSNLSLAESFMQPSQDASYPLFVNNGFSDDSTVLAVFPSNSEIAYEDSLSAVQSMPDTWDSPLQVGI